MPISPQPCQQNAVIFFIFTRLMWEDIYLLIFYLFIYLLYLEANYFTILWWFLPYIDISQPWVYMCPPVLNHPLTAPSPSFHSLGYPSAAALSAQFHALKLDWSSISHMVIYIFQCYSLKPSHPRHLPQNEKSVLYMCVSFAVKNIGSSLPFF